MEKRRIYISGPISGYDYEERRQVFMEAKLLLQSQGFEVFNPMENGLPKEAGTRLHMRRDLNELTREDRPYDAIYMMRRWTHSAGCLREFETAISIGLDVFFEESGCWVKFE